MNAPDNVTPFPSSRRPPPKAPDLRVPALAVYGLGLIAFALFLSGRQYADLVAIACAVGAVIIAAGRRDEGPAWIRSHHEFGLRTLVIAGAIWTLLSLVAYVPFLVKPALFARVAIGLWLAARCLYGIVQTVRKKIISNPRTALF
jgi:uncharacterized membrane protein